MSILKKSLVSLLSISVLFGSIPLRAQAPDCQAEKMELVKQLESYSAQLGAKDIELEKLKAQGHRTIKKTAKITTGITGILGVLVVIGTYLETRGPGEGMGRALIAGVGLAGAAALEAVAGLSGTVWFLTSNPKQEVQISELQAKIQETRNQVKTLTESLQKPCP